MNYKSLAVAVATVMAVGTASADTLSPILIDAQTGSFSNVVLGSITLTQQSNLTGSIFAATEVTVLPGFTFPLKNVSFSFAGFDGLTDLDASATGFNYANLAAGTYQLLASGTLSGTGPTNAVFLTAQFATSPAPEPATYALMLAGVAAIGFVAKRRRA